MPTYRVLYAKSEHFRDTLQHPERVTRDNLTDTHVVVALEHAATPDAVFHNMQGEHMTPVLAQRVAQEAGRTSMSVGDALFCVDGSILVCDRAGWIKHDPVEPIYAPTRRGGGRCLSSPPTTPASNAATSTREPRTRSRSSTSARPTSTPSRSRPPRPTTPSPNSKSTA